jgi:hypothetical protein
MTIVAAAEGGEILAALDLAAGGIRALRLRNRHRNKARGQQPNGRASVVDLHRRLPLKAA